MNILDQMANLQPQTFQLSSTQLNSLNRNSSATNSPVRKGAYLNPSVDITTATKNLIVDEFNSAYWSGLDLNVFFNDVYIDDLVQIQYQISENIMPVFAWGDYTPRYVNHGSRIVQGSFAINFKRSHYMNALLQYLSNPVKSGSNNTMTPSSLKAGVSMPETVDQILGAIKGSGGDSIDLDKLSEISNYNQNKFWGATANQNIGVNPDVESGPMFFGGVPGFSIIFRFGDIDYGSDYRITYGKNGPNVSSDSTGTIFSLTGVNISGVGVAVDDSGKNIMEVYSFMAKDKVTEIP